MKCVSLYTYITRDVLSIKPCSIRMYVRVREREVMENSGNPNSCFKSFIVYFFIETIFINISTHHLGKQMFRCYIYSSSCCLLVAAVPF